MEYDRLLEMKLKGYCCSQIIMALGLEDMGKENPDLILAMGGLCDGLHEGRVCGTLTAAICLLYVADGEKAFSLNSDLIAWFEETFGSTECHEIVGDNPLNKVEICPEIVDRTYERILEFIEDNNIEYRA